MRLRTSAFSSATSSSGRIAGCIPARSGRRASTCSRRHRLQVNSLLKPAEGVPISWSQTTDEVLVKVPVDSSVRGKDVKLEVHPTRLQLAVGGQTLLAGSLSDAGSIRSEDSFWVLETDDSTSSKYIQVTLVKSTMGYMSWEKLLEEDKPDTTVTHRVALDVAVGDRTGRIILGLFGNVVPKTVENFKCLVTGEKGHGAADVALHLKGSKFHRIIPGFMAQGGDITAGDGSGGDSIYGKSFEDENFKLKHDVRGVLAMANAGPNTNNSQFYITFMPTPHLDGKHVVFGKVEAGWSTLMMMEGAGTEGGAPTKDVVITDCRLMDLSEDPEAAVEQLASAQREQRMAEEFLKEMDQQGVQEQQETATQ